MSRSDIIGGSGAVGGLVGSFDAATGNLKQKVSNFRQAYFENYYQQFVGAIQSYHETKNKNPSSNDSNNGNNDNLDDGDGDDEELGISHHDSNTIIHTADEASKFVRESVSSHRIMVFSKSYCQYSQATKNLLREYVYSHGIKYHVVEVDLLAHQEYNKEAPQLFKEALTTLYGRTTFPSIFIDGTSIGGNDNLQALENLGVLADTFDTHNVLRDTFTTRQESELREFINSHKLSLITAMTNGNSNEWKSYGGYASEQISLIIENYSTAFDLKFYQIDIENYLQQPHTNSVSGKSRDAMLRNRIGVIENANAFPILVVDNLAIPGAKKIIEYYSNGTLMTLLEERHLINA
ncbi:hypothetical protein H4219_005248 [Mycoemilia scoparia]|uniref:Glutaredoxin domain-containing protein n=1 Tax=Mycoemilia scoparia TaxID=417184 RepID=A0A9W7ZPV1_9FUNG|nr:hypothetical protein H4219_005248 [Mycoemilia scoparia]